MFVVLQLFVCEEEIRIICLTKGGQSLRSCKLMTFFATYKICSTYTIDVICIRNF